MIKILNLYSGIGGNRRLWKGNIKVTAIENDEKIASIYKDFFPNDEVIITDAHEYLLKHFREYDFIWSSPPCQTHSIIRWKFVNAKMTKKSKVNLQPKYPDMKLYEEIILLDKHFKGKWIVENVKSYYKPLIIPKIVAKHYIWSNFEISNMDIGKRHHLSTISEKQKHKGFDLSKYKGIYKQGILRNCMESEVGLHILKSSGLI
jgi:DNA (cytosine-5)-methyltransferase 1